jgi:hypothetical protein
VVSFGADTKLEPQMMVYRDEVHPYVQDYPKSLIGKKSYRRVTGDDKKNRDIRAELVMDVLIPVHKLLGAYLKCYITTTEAECPLSILSALLEPDFCDGHISKYKSANFYAIYAYISHAIFRHGCKSHINKNLIIINSTYNCVITIDTDFTGNA